MKTKNIFKALAFALLMPAMLLTTACSSDNDVITNNENINKKGYEIPVTLNATRQGDDATTRATYNPDTKKLEYSTGDQLYVFGNHATAGMFYGTLDWQGDIIFSGTITTTNPYSGTGIELLSSAIWARAMLLPAGYNNYQYITIDNPGISCNLGATFATSKATAIEQFSFETVSGYNNGFALVPQNAILNFTITGLTPSTEFTVQLWNSYYSLIEGNVTTNGSGTATFAIGIDISTCTEYEIADLYNKGWDLRIKDNNNVYVLRMYDDNTPLVTSSKPLVAGKIYNITRSATSVPAGAINGKFTISDDNGAHTRQVYFSKGNLQAVIASGPTENYNYTASSWKFADHQWDIIGNNPGNSTFAAGTTVDLFAWVGTTALYDTYGLCTYYDANNDYYGTNSSDNLKSDWGNTMGSGWFTLTKNEWVYLFNTRAASTVNGTENARYAKAYLFGTTHGIILFPDIYTHPDGVEAPTGINNTSSTSWNANQYDATDWAKMEAAGCVFLPAAGTRYYSVNFANSSGYYWSSSPNPSNVYNANYMYFGSNALTPQTDGYRFGACSVRLVHE